MATLIEAYDSFDAITSYLETYFNGAALAVSVEQEKDTEEYHYEVFLAKHCSEEEIETFPKAYERVPVTYKYIPAGEL